MHCVVLAAALAAVVQRPLGLAPATPPTPHLPARMSAGRSSAHGRRRRRAAEPPAAAAAFELTVALSGGEEGGHARTHSLLLAPLFSQSELLTVRYPLPLELHAVRVFF